MHHQFAELADVDITKEPMEVGPTCHYVMGGIEVDADSQMTSLPGLFAAGEAAGGMHGSNRLGGNSLSDLLVFGKLAGDGAVEFIRRVSGRTPEISDEELQRHADEALAPFAKGSDADAENPYALHADLQDSMNTLVGIIRREGEVAQALEHLDELDRRAEKLAVDGPLIFNPGWHLTFDLRNMLLLSRCIALAALTRTESRGGHTREDHPAMDPEWRRKLLFLSLNDDGTRGADPGVPAADPSGSARPVREERAEEVPHRRGDRRPRPARAAVAASPPALPRRRSMRHGLPGALPRVAR